MFKIKGRFAQLGLEGVRFTKTLDTALKEQIRQAARAWLREVITHVPIWTGTSMGSLRPLGAYLRVKVPDHYVAVRKGYGPSVGKANQEFEFSAKGGVYTFSFTEEVAHYLVNEYFNVNETGKFHLKTPGPWRSFYYGEVAFEKYIDDNLVRKLPNLGDFVTVNYTRFDG